MAFTEELARIRNQFQGFLNQLMPYGANVSILDDKLQPARPLLWFATPTASVESARVGDEGTIIYDVVLGQPGWMEDPHDPGGSSLLVTVSDPAIEIRPGQYVFERRDAGGNVLEPVSYVLLAEPHTFAQAEVVEGML